MTEPASVVAAVVQVGALETPYRRAGRGPPAVVLAATEAERSALLRLLAPRFRVVAPELPAPPGEPPDPALGSWLRAVLEALGVDRPTLVLAGDLAAHAPALVDATGEPLGPVTTA